MSLSDEQVKRSLLNWASEQDDPEKAKYFIKKIMEYEKYPGDLMFLDQALKDFSDEGFTPIPKDVIARRFSEWAGNDVSPDHEIIQNYKKYYDIIINSDYIEDLSQKELNDLKTFGILLINTVNPQYSEDIKGWVNTVNEYIKDIADIEEVYLTTGAMIYVIDGGFVIYDGDKILALDKHGNKLPDVDVENVFKKGNYKTKRKISQEQAFKVLGPTLYDQLFGDEISPFDLP